jgi:hypothetical protein
MTDFEDKPAVKTKKRFAFTPDEDDRLRSLVAKFGLNSWTQIASRFRKRDPRQCRERWFNYLSPDVRATPWTYTEDDLLAAKVAELGRKWNTISTFFAGRTAINVKNHWNYLCKRRKPPPPEETDSVVDPIERLFEAFLKDGGNLFSFGSTAGDFSF